MSEQTQRARQIAALVAIVLAGCVLAFVLGGGGEADDKSSPKTKAVVVQSEAKFDTQAADVIALPTGWRAVAVKCDGFGHRVYVTRGSNPRIAVFADKECR
jgi:hypothetical protein